MQKENIHIQYVPIEDIRLDTYNPRKWNEEDKRQLKESITRFGVVDPLLVNNADNRKNILIGGHFRLEILRELNYKEIPIIYVNISDIEKEKELCIRLNKNQGEFDLDILKQFDESFLVDVGFNSEEIDDIFAEEKEETLFDLEKELKKLDIEKITVQKGDIYEINGSRIMCGDSTIEENVLSLMDGQKANMTMTDPPYILDYLKGKTRHGVATTGFGAKKNRRYLETESLPDNFTELWMNNVAKIQSPDFSIIVYENWKNIRTIWGEMEKHWKVRNMLVWHLPNRNQGYAGKHKFFSKYDIAMVGTSENKMAENNIAEDELIENEYESALFAISGKPHWESYGKGKKYCPTDFIEFKAADEKSSGQGIIFGTKPTEILVPYIKILTERNQIVFEPFGGSGSTLIASLKLGRRCYIMEKSPIYTEVILRRWEMFTGKKRIKKYV